MTRTIAALVLMAAGFTGGLVFSSRIAATTPTAAPDESALVETAAPAAAQATPARAVPAGALPDLSSVAEAALRVSVNVYSTNIVRRNDPWSTFFFEEPAYQAAQSSGSGVIVSSDGLILTNTHVIGGANAKVRVMLSDGQERPATIVGLDDLSDLSVLKVDLTGLPALPTLPWGDSSKLRVAEWVLAVGNPFQLSGTVTLGIVSTVSRSQSGGVTDFIQTDAAINQGNSGGALVNARGELVGINSMIYSDTGGNLGIGFAIPSNLARQIMSELVTNGTVQWGSVGYVQWIEPEVARRFGVNVDGLLVNRIDPNSAAYRAGLRVGDVILAFNGQKPQSREEMDGLIARARAGTRVTVDVDRDGRRVSLVVPVESRQAQQPRLRRR